MCVARLGSAASAASAMRSSLKRSARRHHRRRGGNGGAHRRGARHHGLAGWRSLHLRQLGGASLGIGAALGSCGIAASAWRRSLNSGARRHRVSAAS